ncbi:MAG TPA: FHA domain-containing protein, partial [Kofleriaceae bacterium]
MSILNDVIRLRSWGTDRSHMLPRVAVRGWFVGTSDSCALRLQDPRAAPVHAQLTYERQRWWIREVGREHGVRQDGVRREEFTLTPGVEIGIGATTLIAESPQTIALREFCARMLGWECDPAVIDHALRAIRLAMTRRTALVLRGGGDLVPVAHALHRRTMGAEAPFIVCDRRRRTAAGSVRAPENHESGVVAFEAASGGSLCVRSSRLPRDFSLLLARLREPEPSVQLVVCLDRDERGALLAGPVPIDVPSMRDRMRDVPRRVDAFAADAIAALGAPAGCLTRDELAWVARHSATTLADIEKGTLRLVARKVAGSLGQAAALLGMAPVSLAR